ncbi:hypothetical protein RQM47_07125 [Rubrivirga sp. S365]|uniref:hypothetical protein n=1 Tax=Rubrivirga sp. S365 TaxID=3076080 RepID=UPI0028C5C5A5|nr:hypothetical protein [Rubrivirga sp. S365]MDT7856408.1 hypothetical protein [Rubrivirga sp. S365]
MPTRRFRPALLLAALVGLAACGSDAEGVAVTEAEPGALRAPTPSARVDTLGPDRPAPLDTVSADSALDAGPLLDSLRAAPDSADAPAAPPDFRAFWPRFQTAARAGRGGLDALAGAGGAAALDARGAVVFGEPFLGRVLALTARDFRRDGVAREATVRVGYDRAGRVVPEDEAAREATATLRFDVVDGAYRLVGLDTAGV